MKSLDQMDLDEWEILPDEGFLEINDDEGKKIYSRKGSISTSTVFEMNYFICPSPEHPRLPDQLLPLPIDLQPKTLNPQEYDDDEGRVIKEVPVEMKIIIPPPVAVAVAEKIKSFSNTPGGLVGVDQDPISQVFFKKMKETEFVDMKMDSPKSSSTPIPQIEGTGGFQFEEKGDDGKDEEEGGVNNVWKWSLTGMGAICSFGVAAATFCIIVFFHQKKKHPPHHKNQKLKFQIYSTDKRVKQVMEQASKLKEAMRLRGGVPISRAHITCGGYYDAASSHSH